MQLLATMQNAFRIADLRRKILFTLAMLVVFRIGSFIPVPGIDASGLASKFGQGNIFGLLDLFAGGSLRRFTIFAMGVNPYITSSIIMTLLTMVIPKLEEMSREGVEGRKKIQQYTRYGTVLLAIIQGYGTVAYVREFVVNPGFFTTATIILTLTAGTMFLMWLGEKISERGIGNGISLIIFAGIVARLPSSALTTFQAIGAGGINPFAVVIFLILAVFVIAAVVLIQEGQRRIPVQYPKRVVGRRVYGGQSTHIPLRVNQAGVIPVIF
ncbi:MAG: preprotein translocase subunit SecY, partial [Syntrophothermus sp.]